MSPTKTTPTTSKPSTPTKLAPVPKTTAALSMLAEAYAGQRDAALAALRAREAEIASSVRSIVDAIETSLAAPDGRDTSALRVLLGETQITSYVRAALASKAIASIVEAESAPVNAASSPTAAPSATQPPAAPTTAGSPKTTEPGTVSLAGPNKWNFGALRKQAVAVAATAGWTSDKLAAFNVSMSAAKKHAEVLAIIRASGLKVAE